MAVTACVGCDTFVTRQLLAPSDVQMLAVLKSAACLYTAYSLLHYLIPMLLVPVHGVTCNAESHVHTISPAAHVPETASQPLISQAAEHTATCTAASPPSQHTA